MSRATEYGKVRAICPQVFPCEAASFGGAFSTMRSRKRRSASPVGSLFFELGHERDTRASVWRRLRQERVVAEEEQATRGAVDGAEHRPRPDLREAGGERRIVGREAREEPVPRATASCSPALPGSLPHPRR
jgi:hypothetical protein